MIKRILVGALALVVVAVLGFAGYGWWTRRGEPSFSKGGTFGSIETPSPTVKSGTASRPKAKKERRRTPARDGSPTTTATRSAAAQRSEIAPPAIGTYRYDGSGRENVRFGPTSACGWDIDDVELVVNEDPDGRFFDWSYSDQRVERLLFSYDDDVRLTFAGAAVTCVGVRRTSDEDYKPPSIWVPARLKVGETWTQTSTAGERTERTTGEVLRRQTVTVGAGTFETFVIESFTELSGRSNGTHRSTTWFAPDLGLAVRKVSATDVTDSGAEFTSEMDLRLASLPLSD